jgi:ribonuclease P protein subunit RPR2
MIQIAKERIDILFDLADEEAHMRNFPRANRYVDLARRIGMRYNVRIPGKFKRRFCKHCHSYIQPGENARVRIKGKKIVVFCQNCGEYMRMPITSHKKGKGN